MTVLTPEEIKKEYDPSSKDVQEFLKKHKLPRNNKKIVAKVRQRLRASKIARTPGKEVSNLQSAGEWQIIYGRARVGGVYTFANTPKPQNEVVHLVITLAGHEIDAITGIYLDDEEVIFGASPDPRWSTGIRRKDGSIAPADHMVFYSPTVGTWNQGANGDLQGQLPALWTAAHKQNGRAHVYMILRWNPLLFPDGIPSITFDVRGKKCKNPVTGVIEWTENPAMIIADYLMNPDYGLGVAEADIDLASWQASATHCYALQTLRDGTQESRFTLNGKFSSSDTPQDILESMCACMAGTIVYANGKWRILAGAYYPPVLDLTEDDIISEIRVQTKLSRRDSFNGIRGTYINPQKNWEETDFPAIKNDYYMQQDGGERVWEDVQYPFVLSPATCQRLAKIELERNRQGITVQLTARLKAYNANICDTVRLTIKRYGWVNKVFEVQESSFSIDQNGDGAPELGIQLLLRETAEAVYAWNNGEETSFDIAPNTQLPDPFSVANITGIQITSGTEELYIRGDGTVFSRMKVSWNPIGDFFVTSGGKIEVEYKPTSSPNWQSAGTAAGDVTIHYILEVQDNIAYDVRVRAINAVGYPGNWTQATPHIVIGKTEPPSSVTNFSGQFLPFGILLSWDEIPDLDRDSYELRFVSDDGDLLWEQSEFLAIVKGTNYRENLRNSGKRNYLIKAIDTSGNKSLNATTLSSTVSGPEAPVVSYTIEGPDITFKWTIPNSIFAIEEYEINFAPVTETVPNPAYSSSIALGRTKSTFFKTKVTWSGIRYFWIAARDVAGNLGTPYLITITILAPGMPQNLRAEVIDNNVLLRWNESTAGTLPIERYQVFKGGNFSSAELVGEVGGTFCAIFEIAGGTFTYHVIAVDSAKNKSAIATITLRVAEPPDFILKQEGKIDPRLATKGENIFIEEYGFLPGTGGQGGIGSPLGLLLAMTQSNGVITGTGDQGSPAGLLLALTRNTGSYNAAGSPQGLLLSLTRGA